MPPHPRSLAGQLDAELEAVAKGTPACGAPHHTNADAACQRVADHATAPIPMAACDLHAAKRIWHDSDTEPVWATWADPPPAPDTP